MIVSIFNRSILLEVIAESVLTVVPQNTVVVAGGAQVVLTCTSSVASTQISWTSSASGAELVTACLVVGSNPQYSVSSSPSGNCNLIINSPITTALAGLYSCHEVSSGASGSSQLIILGENSWTHLGSSFSISILSEFCIWFIFCGLRLHVAYLKWMNVIQLLITLFNSI